MVAVPCLCLLRCSLNNFYSLKFLSQMCFNSFRVSCDDSCSQGQASQQLEERNVRCMRKMPHTKKIRTKRGELQTVFELEVVQIPRKGNWEENERKVERIIDGLVVDEEGKAYLLPYYVVNGAPKIID